MGRKQALHSLRRDESSMMARRAMGVALGMAMAAIVALVVVAPGTGIGATVAWTT